MEFWSQLSVLADLTHINHKAFGVIPKTKLINHPDLLIKNYWQWKVTVFWNQLAACCITLEPCLPLRKAVTPDLPHLPLPTPPSVHVGACFGTVLLIDWRKITEARNKDRSSEVTLHVFPLNSRVNATKQRSDVSKGQLWLPLLMCQLTPIHCGPFVNAWHSFFFIQMPPAHLLDSTWRHYD